MELEESKVIQNSDFMFKKPSPWITDVEYKPPNDFEIKMLEGTIKPEQLLEQEKNEQPKEQTEEQKLKGIKTMIKIVAMDRMGCKKHLENTSLWSVRQKKELIKQMEYVLTEYNNDKKMIEDEFNEIVCHDILGQHADVSQYIVRSD
jgi:hypothetical protein